MKKAKDIDEYISCFPVDVQNKLTRVRAAIRKAAPDAMEKISYAMPAFYQEGNLVYFAAYANHIGFYPTATGITSFQSRLKNYKTSKGAVQFPLDKPLPVSLISDIVKFRVKQNNEKIKIRKR